MTGPFEEIFAEFEKAEAFSRRVQRAITGLDVGRGAERGLLNLVGAGSTPSELTMAHMSGLKAAAALLCSVVEQAYTELSQPGTAFYKLTVIGELGAMSQASPHLAVVAQQRAVERAMKSLELSGLGFPRLQPVFDNLFAPSEHALLLYDEALCWGTGCQQALLEKVGAMNDSLSFELPIEVAGISLERIAPDVVSALCVPVSLCGMPSSWWHLETDYYGFEHFCDMELSFGINHALRVTEGLSHVLIRDAVFAVGEGIPLKDVWQRKLSGWQDEQYFLDTSSERGEVKIDVKELWRAVRTWAPNYFRNPFTLE
jgi:hypothetical protein